MRFLAVLFAALLAATLPAQVVRLANHGPTTFRGWKRTTIDTKAPHEAGKLDRAAYVLGRPLGDGTTRVVDVLVELRPGERLKLSLADAEPWRFEIEPLPADPIRYYGGQLELNGKAMDWVSFRRDGAAYCSHLRARTGQMTCVDLWIRHYPGEAWAEAEALVIASNPAVPLMGESLAALRVTFGHGLVLQPGRRVGSPLLDPNTYLADGQGKYLPLTFIWTRHLRSASDWSSAGSVAGLSIGAIGIQHLWPTGTPPTPRGFDALAWADLRLGESIRRLYTWDPPVVGPPPVSSTAGPHEDQLYHPGTEALLHSGAEWVRVLSAGKIHAERPCNHLEPDGSPLDLKQHPNLRMWDGRPFNSPDMLGKPRPLEPREAHERWGPDTQHLFTRSLTSSFKQTARPALQQLIRNRVTVYLAQRTAEPGVAQSGTWSAREWAWEGLFIAETVDPLLEDRELAARAVQRWRDRVQNLLLPILRDRDYIHTYLDDGRIGPGHWVSAWMECCASWGIDLACERVGPPEGREAALRIADLMLRDAWVLQDGVWLTREVYPLEGPKPAPKRDFNGYGMPLAVATVLRHRPDDERARAIWRQILADQDYRFVPALPARPRRVGDSTESPESSAGKPKDGR